MARGEAGSAESIMEDQAKTEKIRYAQVDGDVVVVQISGRGDHELSHTLKAVSEKFNRSDYSPLYVLDLEACVGLDSTFMGSMATMAMYQSSQRKERLVVVNTNTITERQITTLGLNYLLDIRKDPPSDVALEAANFTTLQPAEPPSMIDRIVHMIEAHERLVDLSSGNAIQFRGVLDALRDSLDEETPKQ